MCCRSLGVNALVQNIDLLSDGGHYDHDKFPWHAQMIDQQCKKLESFIGSLSLEKCIDLIIGLARIPVEPVNRLINICLEIVSIGSFSERALKLYFDTEYCETLAKHGPNFLTENDTTTLMLCHYLHRSNVPITGENLRKELVEISKAIVEDITLTTHSDRFLAEFLHSNRETCAEVKVGTTTIIDSTTLVCKFKKSPPNCSFGPSMRQNSEHVDVKGGKLSIVFIDRIVGLQMSMNKATQDIELEFTILLKHAAKTVYSNWHQAKFDQSFFNHFTFPTIKELAEVPIGEEFEVTVTITKWKVSPKEMID